MSSSETIMLIVGDVFVNRDDPPSVFQHVKDVLRSADIVLGNLEGSHSDAGEPWPKGDVNVWRSNSKQIAAIEAGGFHAMGVTNNHVMDFGYGGLFGTMENLDAIGVKHAGGGHDLSEAHAPAIVSHQDSRVALLAYTSVFTPGWDAKPDRPGLAVMRAKTSFEPHPRTNETPGKPPKVRSWLVEESKQQLAEDIAAARTQSDIVVCSFHWGVSQGHLALTDYQVELAHLAVDLGADLVFGHHPHLLQGVEVYCGKAIFYSLGNFTFARHNPSIGHELETAIIRCRIQDKQIKAVEYLPACSDDKIDPHILSVETGGDVIRRIASRSLSFGTKFVEAGDAIRVVLEN